MIAIGVFILIATIKRRFLKHLDDVSPALKSSLGF